MGVQVLYRPPAFWDEFRPLTNGDGSGAREFQAHPLLPEDQGDAGKRTSTVRTHHDALKLFFALLEEEDDDEDPPNACGG